MRSEKGYTVIGATLTSMLIQMNGMVLFRKHGLILEVHIENVLLQLNIHSSVMILEVLVCEQPKRQLGKLST